jgi:hypothetical protein
MTEQSRQLRGTFGLPECLFSKLYLEVGVVVDSRHVSASNKLASIEVMGRAGKGNELGTYYVGLEGTG